METENLSFKLEAFEGPLDLLLHLIEKNKVDIYDIPISLITDQYLEYLSQIEKKDADIMSEFLVMAATLLDIKAKMLLPKEESEEGEQEDPRAELVEKLIEYKMYKYMSYELKDRQITVGNRVFKEPTIPEEIAVYESPIDLDAFMNGATLTKLEAIFRDVVARVSERTNTNALNMQSIQKEQVNISDRADYIRKYLAENGSASFRGLIEGQRTKINIIVMFLAVLELMKAGEIYVRQDTNAEDMTIKLKHEGDDRFDEDFEIPEDIKKREQKYLLRKEKRDMESDTI